MAHCCLSRQICLNFSIKASKRPDSPIRGPPSISMTVHVERERAPEEDLRTPELRVMRTEPDGDIFSSQNSISVGKLHFR